MIKVSKMAVVDIIYFLPVSGGGRPEVPEDKALRRRFVAVAGHARDAGGGALLDLAVEVALPAGGAEAMPARQGVEAVPGLIGGAHLAERVGRGGGRGGGGRGGVVRLGGRGGRGEEGRGPLVPRLLQCDRRLRRLPVGLVQVQLHLRQGGLRGRYCKGQFAKSLLFYYLTTGRILLPVSLWP